MLRQYLFDAFETHRLAGLCASKHQPLAEVATRIRNEELYHIRHTRAWVIRLGQGTEESHDRMQKALNELWPYAQALGAVMPSEPDVNGFVPETSAVFSDWLAEVTQFLKDATLEVPNVNARVNVDRAVHSEYFPALIDDLQEVAQADPEAQW
jgi:ring-1,2-phenylacetyl-CoA epoxidase subunit PaaC